MKLESVVISQQSQGYIAYLRFLDKKLNMDIAHPSKPVLYSLIEKYVKEKLGGLYG